MVGIKTELLRTHSLKLDSFFEKTSASWSLLFPSVSRSYGRSFHLWAGAVPAALFFSRLGVAGGFITSPCCWLLR